MNPSADVGRITTPQWDLLEDLVSRFEDAWRQRPSEAVAVDLRAYLPLPDDPLRALALHELVKSDLEIRWRAGKQVWLEHYLELFPELGTMQDTPAQLVYEEYRARQLYGDKPPLKTYEQRFPKQFAGLRQLLIDQPVPEAVPVLNLAAKDARTEDDIPRITGGYRKVHALGRGGFGEVWRALAPGDVDVALKIIHRPINHADAQRELQALDLIKRLHHPFLLPMHAFWALPDRLIIAMELAEGNLRDRLKACQEQGLPTIPVAELLSYLHEAAEALDYLHGQKVYHRDIKPDNVLLLRRHAKLADFGLVRFQETWSANISTAGTPAYMPPESWQGRSSEHTDQYSLAATYAELRLERRLFPGTSMFEMMVAHTQRTPNLAPLGREEQDILLRALAKDPHERFASCLEFVQALHRAVMAPPAPRRLAAAPRRLTGRVLVLLTLALLLVFGGLLYWLLG